MSILDNKKKIFGQIAAAKTLTESMPKLKTDSSFPSINNNGDSITFLCDLIKSLIGYEELEKTLTDTLVYGLKDFEKEVKAALKTELKSIVSCGVDPSIPDFMTSGINYTVDKVDFTDMMFIEPNSDAGKVMYTDLTPNLINSSDLNTFLYQTIQNDGSTETWPSYAGATLQILTFEFVGNGVPTNVPNNSITVKAHPSYANKTLTDLNNDFIDSVSLFNTEKLLTKLIDMVFGTVSSFANKSLKQLEKEAKINTVVDKISNAQSKDIISDKYFTFSSEEKTKQLADAKNRKIGVKKIDTSNGLNTSVNFGSVQSLNTDISLATNDISKTAAVSSSLNSLSDQVASISSNNTDKKAIKLNFIQELINNIIKAIVNTILSPKVISIFIINFKIIYGPTATFDDPIDFMKKNKNLVHNITKKISELIIKTLLKLAMKKISALVADSVVKQQIDKNQSNLTQLLSLIGVSPEILRQIKGFL